MSHTDLDSNGTYKIRTIGRLLDEKVCIEGMFSICLHARVIDNEFVFSTQHDGVYLAKSPDEMFDSHFIKNDLKEVRDKMKEYFEED